MDQIRYLEKIVEILVLDDKQVYFYCQKWHTIGIDSKLNAFSVVPNDIYCLVAHASLCDYKPLSLWYDYKNKESFLSLRHMLF